MRAFKPIDSQLLQLSKLSPKIIAGIAQLVEQGFCKPQVPCSNHGAGTK